AFRFLPSLCPQPVAGRGEEGGSGGGVVLTLKKTNESLAAPEDLVVTAVDVRGDAPDRFRAPVGEEQLCFAVLEKDALRWVDESRLVANEGRHPVAVLAVEPPGHLDEHRPVPGRAHAADLDRQHAFSFRAPQYSADLCTAVRSARVRTYALGPKAVPARLVRRTLHGTPRRFAACCVMNK